MRSLLYKVLLMLGAFAVLAGSGCSTTETENVSERPWNQPQGWERGLPSSMYDYR